MAEKKIKDVETERFDGHSIIKSKKYKRYADLLCVELEEGVMYSHDYPKSSCSSGYKSN